MRTVPVRTRLVEVIADHGAGSARRWRYASGLVVGNRQVLTAAHTIGSASSVSVRGPDKVLHRIDLARSLIGAHGEADLALLRLPDSVAPLPPVPVGVIDRDGGGGDFVDGCWAVGYPRFQEIVRDGVETRETAHVRGHIPPMSGLVEDLVTLQVTATPNPLPQHGPLSASEWSGMSGAAVFAGDLLIGVVSEHSPRRGPSDITVTPLAKLVGRDGATGEWLRRLGVEDPSGLPTVPAVARSEPAYRATLREIRSRTKVLLGRERELDLIKDFATSATSPGYLWLMSGPWGGKTALLAEAVHVLPAEVDVDVVAYFLIGRESQATREHFLAAVIPQLAWLLDQPQPEDVDVHVFRDLWGQAAHRAARLGRRLLLVVDGLDEDLGGSNRSVAALLPTGYVGAHAHVIVSSRPHPELAADVDVNHPLRSTEHLHLVDSPYAAQLEGLAKQEINVLLGDDRLDGDSALAFDVLGLLTAAAGPLTVDDLAALLPGTPTRAIRHFVEHRAGRSLQPVGRARHRRYQFAHQTLLDHCREHPDVGGEPRYRLRLHEWAGRWRAERWPTSETPLYLLDTYPVMLMGDSSNAGAQPPEWARLATLVCDVGWVDAAVSRTNPEQVLATVRLAALAVPRNTALGTTSRLLHLQSHHLRRDDATRHTGFTATQLAWESLRVDLAGFATAAAEWLRQLPGSQFIPLWTSEYTSPYLVRAVARAADSVWTFVLHPDERTLYTGDRAGSVLAWRLDDPATAPRPITERDSSVEVIAATPRGHVVVGWQDGLVTTWNPDTPTQPPHTIDQRTTPVNAITTTPQGHVVIGWHDGLVTTWNPDTPTQPPHAIHRGTTAVNAITTTPQGHAVIGWHDGLISLCGPLTGGPLPVRELGRHGGEVNTLACARRGPIVSTSQDGVVLRWDRAAPGPGRELGRDEGVARAAVITDSGRLLTGGGGGPVWLWDVNRSVEDDRKSQLRNRRVWVVTVLESGRVITAARGGAVWAWDLTSGDVAPDVRWQEIGRHGDTVNVVAPVGRGRFLSGGRDQLLRLWDSGEPEGRSTVVGRYEFGPVRTAAATGDGRVVVAGRGGVVCLWDLGDPGSPGVELGRHDGPVRTIAASGDGRVVSGGSDGTVRLWEPDRPGHAGRVLGRHHGLVRAVAITDDGRALSVAGDDGAVWLWELDHPGAQAVALGKHNGAVRTIALTGGGKAITGGDDGAVWLWDLDLAAPSRELGHMDYGPIRTIAVNREGRVAVAAVGDLALFDLTYG